MRPPARARRASLGGASATLLALALAACAPPPGAEPSTASAPPTVIIAPQPGAGAPRAAAGPAPEARTEDAAPPAVAAVEDAPLAKGDEAAAPAPAAETKTPEVSQSETTLASLPPAPPEPPPVDDDPGQVMGLDRAGLAALLGKPGFTRREAGAQVWQYRLRRCVLDVFLYGEADGRFRVTYYEFRGERLDAAGERRCFRTLLGAADPG